MESLFKLLKINRGEETKLYPFFFIAALLQAGLSIGFSVADTEFLNTLGADRLPQLFLFMPVMMIFFTPLFSFLLSRQGAQRVLLGAAATTAAGGFLFFALFAVYQSQKPEWLIFASRLYAYLWMVSLYSIFWSFVDRYFTILDAKRLFPFFSAGLAFGGMLGGALVSTLAEVIQPFWFFPLWSLTSIIALPVIIYVLRKHQPYDIEDQEVQDSFFASLWGMFGGIKKSPYILYLNLVLFLTLFLTTLAEFEYLRIFSENRNESELIQLFGNLFFLANLINLLLNVFIFNRLIALFGVRNTTFVLPLSYLVAFLFLWGNPSFSSALVIFFAYQTVMLAIDANNMNFLFNAVPEERRSSVRVIAEGLTDPIATCLAGLFLLFTPQLDFNHRDIALCAIGILFVQFLCLFLLRKEYVLEMLTNLKKGWLNFSNHYLPSTEKLQQEEYEKLIDACNNSSLINDEIHAYQVLYAYDPDQALRMLLAAIFSADNATHKQADRLLNSALEDAPSESLKFILEWLTDKEAKLSPETIAILGRYGLIQQAIVEANQVDPDSRRRACASIILWSNFKLEDTNKALDLLRELLNSEDEEDLIKAIEIIGYNGEEKYAHFLSQYLRGSKAVRAITLSALEILVTEKSARLWPEVLPFLTSNLPLERELAMRILEKIGDSASIQPLLKLITRMEPREKRILERFIEQTGLKLVPTLINVLRDSSIGYLGRSIAARSLSKLSFAQLEVISKDLILFELKTAYSSLECSILLEKEKNSYLLKRFYEDQLQETLEFILEILALSGQLPNYELISASLRSDSQKLRGDAIETLEQAVPGALFKILLPLVDARPAEQKIAFFHRHFVKKAISIETVYEDSITGPNELLQVAAADSILANDPENGLKKLKPLINSPFPGAQSYFRDLLSNNGKPSPQMLGLHKLAQHSLTMNFPLEANYLLVRQAENKAHEPNSVIVKDSQTSNTAFILAKGHLSHDQDLVHTELFYKSKVVSTKVTAKETSEVLKIEREAIEDTIRLFPQMGIKLLEMQSEGAIAS